MDTVWGYGVVGQATAYALNIDTHYDKDPKKSNFFSRDIIVMSRPSRYFICVPTPTNNGKQDLSHIRESIDDILEINSDANIIIRSTVLPGTTRLLQNEFKIGLMFMPEFLSEATALEDSEYPEFVFVGGDDNVKKQEILDLYSSSKGYSVSLETAELVKYAMNTFFGTKVVLGNVFRDIAEQTGADYWMVKEALETHKWGSVNGWNPFHGNKRGFGGKCLPKDIRAISSLDKTGFIKSLLEANETFRKI